MNDYSLQPAPATDFFSTAFLFGNVGAPFVIGLAVGYFAKKMLRMALFLGGAAIVLLFVSEYYGFTQVDNNDLQHATETALHMTERFGGFLSERLSQISTKGASAVAGCIVGLKMG
ncbi:MAG: FUN14 domain-containing protein [Thiothrix sp.]